MKFSFKNTVLTALTALWGVSADVMADVPRPEYPRPQFERSEWLNLNGNTRAKHLYEKMGFVEAGRSLRALKFDDGSYRDEICMIKMLPERKQR